jgi:hypothetical protein
VQGTHTAFKHIEGCCKNVLYKYAVSLTGSARNTNGFKNTRGLVKMCRTGPLFSYQAGQGTHTVLKNTPEGVVRMDCTGLLSLYQAVQGTQIALKTHQRVL